MPKSIFVLRFKEWFDPVYKSHGFKCVQERGIAYKPDIVLLLFSENDIMNNINKEQYRYFKPYFILDHNNLKLRHVPVPRAVLRQKVNRFLLGRTYLGRLISFAAFKIRPNTDRFHLVNAREIQVSKPLAHQDEYQLTYHLIRAVIKLCRKHGAKFKIVSVPVKKTTSAFLRSVFSQEDIPYLTLDSTFSKMKDRVTFPHDSHWNPTGHQIAARAIDEYLQRLHVF